MRGDSWPLESWQIFVFTMWVTRRPRQPAGKMKINLTRPCFQADKLKEKGPIFTKILHKPWRTKGASRVFPAKKNVVQYVLPEYRIERVGTTCGRDRNSLDNQHICVLRNPGPSVCRHAFFVRGHVDYTVRKVVAAKGTGAPGPNVHRNLDGRNRSSITFPSTAMLLRNNRAQYLSTFPSLPRRGGRRSMPRRLSPWTGWLPLCRYVRRTRAFETTDWLGTCFPCENRSRDL